MNYQKRALLALLAVSAVGLSVPAQAAGWYLGLGAGTGYAADAANNVATSAAYLAGTGIVTVGTYDTNQPAFSLFGGIQFNPYIAMEAGYIDFGSYSLTGIATSGGGTVAFSETDQIDAVYLAAVGFAHLNRVVSLFGKLGLADSTVSESCTVSGTSCLSANDSALEPMAGIGVEFRFMPRRRRQHLAMRVEYDNFTNVGNSNNDYTAGNFHSVTVSGLFRF